MKNWESIFLQRSLEIENGGDPSHDILHLKRVVSAAKKIGLEEGAQMEIVIPAAWFHDCVVVPKNSPQRKMASRLSAEAAIQFLNSVGYDQKWFSGISHAIEAHSFSAQITPQTLEAKVVQDADRLDALGAIGIARCFTTAGLMKTSYYQEQDPFCRLRQADDKKGAVDHFYTKLFQVADTLQTGAAKKMGFERTLYMKSYLEQFEKEILPCDEILF